MAIQKALIRLGRTTVCPTTDRLTNVGSTYNGITKRNNSEYDAFFSSGTTDANGRITFNLTTDGTATGPAMFSAIHTVNAITQSTSTTIANLPSFYVETISANLKQITIRGIAAQAGLVILGIAISQQAFAGAGITGLISVWGLP